MIFTCKGKGGRYKVITGLDYFPSYNGRAAQFTLNEDDLAKGSGTSRDAPMIVVYQDVATEMFYYRTQEDFMNRMRLVLPCAICEAQASLEDRIEAQQG